MRSKYFCVLLFIFWSFPLISQNVDSLLQLLSNKEIPKQEQYNTIQELLTSNSYITKNSNKASILAEEQYILAKQLGLSSDIEKALYNKIRVSIIAQNHTQCLEEIELYLKLNNPPLNHLIRIKTTKAGYLHKIGKSQLALQIYENLLLKEDLTTQQLFTIQNGIGLIHYRLGKYSQAIDVYESLLLKIDTIKNFNCEKAILNTNIGNVFYSLNDLEKTLNYYESSIKYQKECGGEERIILKVANLGKLHLKAKRYDRALKHFNESLALSIKFKTKVYEIDNNIEIANVYIQQGFLIKAKEVFKALEKVVLELEEYETVAFYYFSYGQLLLQMNEYSLGKEYCQKAYKMAKKSDHIAGMKMCTDCLIEAYELTKNYESALFWVKEKQMLIDSIQDKKAIKKVAQYEAKMEMLEKQRAYEQEIIHSKLREEKVKTRNSYLFLIIGLCLSLLAFYIKTYFNNKKSLHLLEDKNKLLQKDVENKKLISIQSTKLKELKEFRTHLFSNISHELQTPLAIINSIANKLSSDTTIARNNGEEISVLKRNGKELRDLTSQLLELSKLEEGVVQVSRTTFYLYELINPLIEEYQLVAKEEEIELIVEGYDCYELELYTDYEKVKIILSNFLSNAIKFSKKKNVVQFVVNYEKEVNTLTFKITDTGIGIPKEYLNKVFERFYTTSGINEQNKQIGLGLGLAISKEYASVLNSTIKLESENQQGTTSTLKIPINKEAEKSIETNKSKVYAHMNKESSTLKDTILIVEDNTAIWITLVDILAKNFNLIFKNDGQEALDYLQKNPSITIIISDIIMPNMDGLAFIQQIQSNKQLAAIPILILTAKYNIEEDVKHLNISPENCLVKPIEKELLLSKIKTLTKVYKLKKLNSVDELVKHHLVNLSTKNKAFVNKIENLVESSLENPDFDVHFLAQKLELSSVHLNRKFKELTGFTVSKFIVEKRYIKAFNLLKTKQVDSVKAVCYSVGISSPKYFSKNFKQRFDVNPSELLKL